MMLNVRACLATIVAAVAVAGCQTDAQTLAKTQPQALDNAIKRAQFDFNCPQATGSVISSEMAQPPIEGPLMRGVERAVYTIGVSGCDQRQTYIVICPQDGSGNCFAGESRN